VKGSDQVARRIVVNRGLPSFPVAIFVIIAFELMFISLVLALREGEKLFWLLFICAGTLPTLLLYWTYSRQDWRRLAYLEQRLGRIAFVPSGRARSWGHAESEVPFPVGSQLEYRIDSGDRYFTGDHGQVLARTFWAVEPNGARHQLLESAAFLNLGITVTNLRRAGILLRVVKTYDGETGEHSEEDITEEYIQDLPKRRWMAPTSVLIGTSGLWLGALAGAFVRDMGYLVAIGLAGFAVIASLTLLSKFSGRAALVELLGIAPSYLGGYAALALISRHAVNR
jgi:hypothetical protein